MCAHCFKQASAQLSAETWHWLMHGMWPSQRKLQSVCAVWHRVLHDWTLALALAPKVNSAPINRTRIELVT